MTRVFQITKSSEGYLAHLYRFLQPHVIVYSLPIWEACFRLTNGKFFWEIVSIVGWLGIILVKGFSFVVPVQFSSVTQSCPTLCDPMNRSTPGLHVHHQIPEFTQTHVHQVSDAIQPSQPLSSPSPAPSPSQHPGLFQWVNSSHEVAKVLEFQL